ncbi:phasin family protein [Kordiimonas sp. SCSIO 12610]|uniref:phasin family protein n=1 Tax=Kordiimonas sp. SCSIO 12610 TaxID=2829597 RepID=UPI00210AD961|nr:phasin family protein [Kordiimonas sp. SCSIO 12610]UTW54788.1 phasin family protein [Kordiimonas sp. SCSIO 12610]
MSKKPKKEMDIARKIWLAGIGAYGKAFNDAQDAYTKMGQETTKIFEDLVGKGTELENKVADTAKKYAPKAPNISKTNIEDRMERMKTALGLVGESNEQNEQVDKIEARLDQIEEKLDALILAVDKINKPVRRSRATTAKKVTPKKTPTK